MRWTKVVALAAAGTVSLAACGGSPSSNNSSSNGGGSGSSSSGAKATAAMDASVKGPAAAISGAKKGGTLTVKYSTAPETFDPTRSYYQDTGAILGQLVLRSLTTYRVNADGTSQLVPDLATDLGKQSSDGMTWTFTLKDGIKYSDGTPIKAADFVYAIKRSFAVDELPDGPTYMQQYLKGGDKYKGPFTDKSAFQGASAPNDKTVVFHLKQKWPTLPYYASFSQVSPIPEAKDTKTNYGNNPIAEGPYMFDKYVKGQSLTLKKNPNWNANSDPARRQYVDSYSFQFGADIVSTQTAILASNGPDATTLNWDVVDSSLLTQAKAKPNQMARGADPCVSYQTIDTRHVPQAVREAYAVAFPYDQVHQAVGDTSLSYAPASSFAPPQLPGFTKYAPVNGLTGQGKGDPAKAKQMLQKAGKSGFEISYYYATDSPQQVKSDAARKSALTAAGFKVKDVGVPKTDLRKHRAETDGKVNTSTGPSGWCYDWPAGDSIYPALFSSAVQTSGQSVGFLGPGSDVDYKSVDSQINKIIAMPVDQQGAEWTKLDEQLAKDYVSLPYYYNFASFLFGTKVHNVIDDPNRGMPDLAQIWVG